jgi:hypothetical protein
VALPISLGCSQGENARELAISKRSVSGLMDELRAELEARGAEKRAPDLAAYKREPPVADR